MLTSTGRRLNTGGRSSLADSPISGPIASNVLPSQAPIASSWLRVSQAWRAEALASAGMHVTVLERKADPGEKLHTTGIIVKDAIDQVALLDGLPPIGSSDQRRPPLRAEDCVCRFCSAGLLFSRHRYSESDALACRTGRTGRGADRLSEIICASGTPTERLRSRRRRHDALPRRCGWARLTSRGSAGSRPKRQVSLRT